MCTRLKSNCLNSSNETGNKILLHWAANRGTCPQSVNKGEEDTQPGLKTML